MLWRQSTIGDAIVCSRRLKYSLEYPTLRKGSIAASKGTAYHAGLEAFYRGEVLTVDDMILVAGKEFTKEVLTNGFELEAKELADHHKDLVTMIGAWDKFLKWDLDVWEVLDVEHQFKIDQSPLLPKGHGLTGTIDLVLRSRSNGQVMLVDHKTAGKMWNKDKQDARKNVQASLYCHSWELLTGDRPLFAFDIVTYAGKTDRRICNRQDSEIELTFLKAQLLIELLEQNGPWLPATDSSLCSQTYCSFWEVCEFGEPRLS